MPIKVAAALALFPLKRKVRGPSALTVLLATTITTVNDDTGSADKEDKILIIASI